MKLGLFFSLVLATNIFGCISLTTQSSFISDIDGVSHVYTNLVEEYKLLWCDEHKDFEIIEVLLETEKVSTILVPLSFQSPKVLTDFEGMSKVGVQKFEIFDNSFERSAPIEKVLTDFNKEALSVEFLNAKWSLKNINEGAFLYRAQELSTFYNASKLGDLQGGIGE